LSGIVGAQHTIFAALFLFKKGYFIKMASILRDVFLILGIVLILVGLYNLNMWLVPIFIGAIFIYLSKPKQTTNKQF
jgi:hypothetical protein